LSVLLNAIESKMPHQKTAAENFQAFTFEGQKSTKDLGFESDLPFPYAIKAANSSATLDEYVQFLRTWTEKENLLEAVRDHGGALLIRGLPIKTADDYSNIAHAFGFKAHEEVGRPPNRTVLAKNVKTANEG